LTSGAVEKQFSLKAVLPRLNHGEKYEDYEKIERTLAAKFLKEKIFIRSPSWVLGQLEGAKPNKIFIRPILFMLYV